MRKILALILAAMMCMVMVACGKNDAENAADKNENANKDKQAEESASEDGKPADTQPEEKKIDYAVVVPEKLQGVWSDTSTAGAITFYTFKDNNVETYLVNPGHGGSVFMTGTFAVAQDRVNYEFESPIKGTGYSVFTYENDTLSLKNTSDNEIKRLTVADVMELLVQEETVANNNGIICLADIIMKYYPDSEESGVAAEKKEAASNAMKTAGEAALSRMNTTYDKVQKLTWYQHKNQPYYADITCYIYPYIGRLDDGTTWLRVTLDYTDAKTDAGWIFYNKVIFSVDGENTTKSFSRNEITRDNDTEVWEIADFEPSTDDILLLKSIASSNETIIRFQGDEHYYDHVVTQNEKDAILDVLAAYDYLTSNNQ